MQSTIVGWQALMKSWMAKLPPYITPAIRANLLSLFLRHIPPGLELVREHNVIELVDANMVVSLCDLFSALLESNQGALRQLTEVKASPISLSPLPPLGLSSLVN
jgi:hypothetical protein